MARGTRVEWDDERLRRNMRRAPNRLDAALAAIISRNSGVGERRMKATAPWTDETGNARQGLHAVPEREKFKYYMVILAHAVSYGIYLETRNNARYAVIEPTMVFLGNKIMGEVSRVFDRVFGS